MTVTEMLAEARLRLTRLEPRQAMERWRGGALLVDIRPQAQRQQEGEIPGALHRATDLSGGFRAWAAAGLPTTGQQT